MQDAEIHIKFHKFCKTIFILGGTVLIEKEEEEEKKIGLREALKRDGSYSYSKVSKILAKMEDEKAEEIGLIPHVHSRNGNKRLFKIKDVKIWMEK